MKQRALEAKPKLGIASWQQEGGLGRCACFTLAQRTCSRRTMTSTTSTAAYPRANQPLASVVECSQEYAAAALEADYRKTATILLSTPARAASRDRYHYASQLTSYTDKEPRTPYPINLELLVLAHVRLLEPIDRALDKVVVLRLQVQGKSKTHHRII